MRVGIFGGSFDPVHLAHLLLAESCLEGAQLDQVLFMPCATQPHKPDRVLADAKHRQAMLELAIGGHPQFAISTLELDRGGVSFTVETLRALTVARPDDTFYFLMGGDSLADFPKWREPEEICRLAIPLVVRRTGSPEPAWDSFAPWVTAQRLAEIQKLQISMPIIELSSTEIRQRVRDKRTIRYRLPRSVEMYIRQQQLYAG
ncbi:MAG: nicotinate-nucleotide adenylyltransferase [Pirellulales bacterium]